MANSKNKYIGTLCCFYTLFTTGCGYYTQQMRLGREIKREPEEQSEFDQQLQHMEEIAGVSTQQIPHMLEPNDDGEIGITTPCRKCNGTLCRCCGICVVCTEKKSKLANHYGVSQVCSSCRNVFWKLIKHAPVECGRFSGCKNLELSKVSKDPEERRNLFKSSLWGAKCCKLKFLQHIGFKKKYNQLRHMGHREQKPILKSEKKRKNAKLEEENTKLKEKNAELKERLRQIGENVED